MIHSTILQRQICYAISKSVIGKGRRERRRDFLESAAGQRYWNVEGGRYVPKGPLFRMLHEA